MSHEVQLFDYPENVNRSKVASDIDSYVRQATWEEGGGGLFHPIRWIEDVTLPSFGAAQEYIKQHDNGNYDQIAVRYKDNSQCKPSARQEALKEKAVLLERAYRAKTEFAFGNNKSAYRGCQNCGSKLALKYLRSNKCPLCLVDLRSDTSIAAEQNAYVKWQKALQEIEAENQKPHPGAKVKWMVKIEYHM